MSELHDVQVGDWLTIVSTTKGSSFTLRQVTSTTTGLVRTLNYTFWRDGRSFSPKQKSVTARPATATEIEQWLAKRKGQQPKSEPSEEVVLGAVSDIGQRRRMGTTGCGSTAEDSSDVGEVVRRIIS